MKKFYSKSTGGFYPASKKTEYEAAGSWPVDAVEVTREEEAALRLPILVQESFAITSVRYLDSLRVARELILNRLAGIGLAAQVNEDAPMVDAIVMARKELLEITSCKTVSAAKSMTALRKAVDKEVNRIADTLPEEARRAFEGVGLAVTPTTSIQ